MKKIFYLAIAAIFIISCIDNTRKTPTDNYDQLKKTEDIKSISIGDLIFLYENMSNQNYVNNKLDSLDYKKKFNGVYISNEQFTTKEPKHWIHTYDIGRLSSVSFSTAEKEKWDELLIEVIKYGDPITFDDGTSSKAIRYIGEKYTFETYEPRNGISISLNNLYQIFVFRTNE